MIPGGQLSNLRQQAIALGLGNRFEAVEEVYAAADAMLGRLVKVTPSSKVVGDLALALVGQGIEPADFASDPAAYGIPDSVIGLLRGDVGTPPGGWPEPLRSRALQGRGEPAPVAELSTSDSAVLDAPGRARQETSQKWAIDIDTSPGVTAIGARVSARDETIVGAVGIVAPTSHRHDVIEVLLRAVTDSAKSATEPLGHVAGSEREARYLIEVRSECLKCCGVSPFAGDAPHVLLSLMPVSLCSIVDFACVIPENVDCVWIVANVAGQMHLDLNDPVQIADDLGRPCRATHTVRR